MFLLTLNIFHTIFPNVSIADFEQINVSWKSWPFYPFHPTFQFDKKTLSPNFFNATNTIPEAVVQGCSVK